MSATPTPWRIRTSGNLGNTIEAFSGKRLDIHDDGYRVVASFQECCASPNWDEQRANCAANGELIVKAVNAYQPMLEALEAVVASSPIEDSVLPLVLNALELARGDA